MFDRYSQLARNFALTAEIDALTAEVAGTFGREGIETLVLKGPVLAKWLYPGEVHPYIDSDLMVAPENRARAVGVLERLGFVEHCPWMPTPLSLDIGCTEFNRGGGIVDLHYRLQRLDSDPDAIWGRLAASTERQVIGGVELCVPDRDTVLLQWSCTPRSTRTWWTASRWRICGERSLASRSRGGRARWSSREYRGVPAFAASLRLLPEGGELARRLDLGEVRSLKHELLREDVIAEELYALLCARVRIRRKVAIAASRSFPRPGYMRWWSPLAPARQARARWRLPLARDLGDRPSARRDPHTVAHPASAGRA